MMKVAIVHDWLTGMRGGEKCLEVFCELYPEAHLFTLLHIPGSVSKTIEKARITTSFIQKMPAAKKYYRHYLPLFPRAIEQFDLCDYDMVISSSHCVAKGVNVPPGVLHICYCYTPMRYIWDMKELYFGKSQVGVIGSKLMEPFLAWLRKWDVASSGRVDKFIAISHNVAGRIEKHYNAPAEVVYPPVSTDFYTPETDSFQDDYYLMVTAFAPYKKIDLAIEAFNILGLPLKIIGTGQDEQRLRKLAQPNIEFLGWQSDEMIREWYRGCTAFIFPGEEDFGITPLEAQACGRPVIAYGRGGALETVVGLELKSGHVLPKGEKKYTGIFFYEQTPHALVDALKYLERMNFDKALIRSHALKFGRKIFKDTIKNAFENTCAVWKQERHRTRRAGQARVLLR